MKIHRRNSESILYEKVRSLHGERLAVWRCIHIERPDGSERAHQAHYTGRIACDTLSGDDGYIYLCEDGHIFILFKGALTPVLRKLSNYFKDFHPRHIDNAQYITVFDLGLDWQVFFELCRRRAYGEATPAHKPPLPQSTLVQY